MTITPVLADELANAFLAAEVTRQPIAPVREQYPDLTEEDAYAIRTALVQRKLAGGAQPVGYKVGATNPTAIATFGLSGPVYGTLFDAGRVAAGGTIAHSQLIHPKLECEVAFVLARDLVGPEVSEADAAAAVVGAYAAFEIVDARTQGWQAKMSEMIGDNVFQARFVLREEGVAVAGIDLAEVEVILSRNGEEVQRAKGANVYGNPARSLAWLANRLAEHGGSLKAGDIVLAGSLTPLLPINAGDRFEAVFSHLGSVAVTFE